MKAVKWSKESINYLFESKSLQVSELFVINFFGELVWLLDLIESEWDDLCILTRN